MLFFITLKKVSVSLFTFVFVRIFLNTLSLSDEDIKGLLITSLRFLFYFNIDKNEFKSESILSTKFWSAAKSYNADAYLSAIRFPEAICDAIIFSPW